MAIAPWSLSELLLLPLSSVVRARWTRRRQIPWYPMRSWPRKQPTSRNAILPWIAFYATLLACGDALAQGGAPLTGRIEGTATLSSELTGRRRAARPYTARGPTALPDRSSSDTNELQHIVVYIERITPAVTAGNSASAPMAQARESFTPHVLPIVAGTTVAFPNDDPIFHNVFSLSRTRTFDLGRYQQGASKSVRFDRPGVVQVFCHIHPDMSAVILVLENSYFTMADSAGHFVLENVPPGQYRLVAWHERIRPVVRILQVTAGGTSRIHYLIPLPLPGPDE